MLYIVGQCRFKKQLQCFSNFIQLRPYYSHGLIVTSSGARIVRFFSRRVFVCTKMVRNSPALAFRDRFDAPDSPV